MIQSRRTFLQTGMAACTVAIAASAGLLTPRAVLAAAWPKSAFKAKNISDALQALSGTNKTTNSSDISLQAPDIAENGAVVSVTVNSKLPKTEQISVLVPHNSVVLCGSYLFTEDTEPYISSRIKMRKSSDIIAVAKAGGKLFSTKKSVKVTIGGCGG